MPDPQQIRVRYSCQAEGFVLQFNPEQLVLLALGVLGSVPSDNQRATILHEFDWLTDASNSEISSRADFPLKLIHSSH